MRVRNETIYRRRRHVTLGAVALVAAGSLTACIGLGGDSEETQQDPAAVVSEDAESTETQSAEAQSEPTTEQEEQETAAEPANPSNLTQLEQIDYITGDITPKSVVANGQGLVIANNMMYSHSMTVYDSTSHDLLETMSDSIDFSEYDINDHPGISQGAPVEAAWTEDGEFAYVSQYTMYGENFGVQGFDDCSPASGVGASYLYRFNAAEMTWDQVIKVGAVPKYVDITPDQTRVLVSNWCDSTISVVDIETATETEVIPVAAAPRGIEVMPDNNTAYVAAMYADTLFKVDLEAGTSEVVMQTTRKPRHLNLSPDGAYLYMAVSGADTIYKIDTATDEIVDEVVSGQEPRSMVMSPDGSALYVVNYYAPSVSKISTDDMELLQTEPTDANPIGITYDSVTEQVWVACYGGSLIVFDDSQLAI